MKRMVREGNTEKTTVSQCGGNVNISQAGIARLEVL